MQYHVKAMQSLDMVVELNVDSVDADDARRQVERLGYEVLTLRSKRAGLAAYLKRRTTFPLTLFSQELIALLGPVCRWSKRSRHSGKKSAIRI